MKKIFIFSALFAVLCAALCATLCACTPSDPQTEDKILLTPVSAGKSSYKIILPRSAGSDETQAARVIRDAVLAACGCELEIDDDYVNENRGILPGEFEILVGDTSRKESRELSRRLRSADRAVAVSGGKLLVLGGTQELTLTAARELAAGISAGSSADGEGVLCIRQSQCFTVNGEYAVDRVLFDGADARDFRIVYPAGNSDASRLADTLRAHLNEVAGIRMSVVSDAAAPEGRELLLGSTNRSGAAVKEAASALSEGESRIVAENGSLFMVGYDIFALRYAVHYLTADLLAADAVRGGELSATLGGAVITDKSPVLSCMSFNILYKLDDDPSRADRVIATVKARMPDTVGFQEVTEQWMDILVRELGDSYDWVGELNDPGSQRWRNAVFYRRDRLELISTETRWLSPTPSVHSKLEASSQYRVYTLAHFRCRDGGGEFCHVNTHIDYNDPARTPQLTVLKNALSRLSQPFVVTGDFNFAPSSKYYRLMTSDGISDAKYLTSDRDDVSTCNSSVIDYCYVSEGNISVRLYRVEDEVTASDHRAVYVEFSLLDTASSP